MTFNPRASLDPYISIEGSDDKAPRAAKESPEPQPHVTSEYDAMAESARNDITSFVAEGRDIRTEVEGLIVWRRFMGEASSAPTWGPTQQAYATHWITHQRARLAKLKSAIEADGKNVSEIIEHIFGEKYRGQYDENVTKQAREELGI